MVAVLTDDVPPRRRSTVGGERGLGVMILAGVIKAEPAFLEKEGVGRDCLLPRTERGVPVCLAALATRGGVAEVEESRMREFWRVQGHVEVGILERATKREGGMQCLLVGKGKKDMARDGNVVGE